MELLISPINVEEARECLVAGVDIIDCKNPREGSLGANFPWVIRAIRALIDDAGGAVADRPRLSATIGDVPFLPGTVSLAALGCATCGVDYVKIGLMGPQTEAQAVEVLSAAVRAVKAHDPAIRVVAAGYADQTRLKGRSIDPLLVPRVAHAAGADVAMLDTAVKDGRGLLDFQPVPALEDFLAEARDLGLATALAGSLGLDALPTLKGLAPDIIGVRSVVCEAFDRVKGSIQAPLITRLQAALAE